MRNIYFLICVLLSAGLIGHFAPLMDIDFTNNSSVKTSYAVEVASFKYPVYTDYFEKLDDVIEIQDEGTYRYVAGITESKSKAERLNKEILDLGYKQARLIDVNEEFTPEQLAGALQEGGQVKQSKKKQKEAGVAISKLTGIGNDYFYTIQLKEDEKMLGQSDFSVTGVKALMQDGKFHYLMGRFDDVGSAQKYLKEKISKNYPNAKLLVLNKGRLVDSSAVKKETTPVGSYNMGRKMRGKEYVDYYYELSQVKFSQAPVYFIEVGPYDDKALAEEAVLKLRDLGFTQAKVATPSDKKEKAVKRSPSADAHFTIQVFASRKELQSTRFHVEGVTHSYDKNDELYRYFYGNYDNYWVCRRDLREVRAKGYKDAFIVKL
eukprot:TRINITY_DN617_c0_g1_i1.p1 TRINITY_DN617_c0_g1~~TRINITY_DN617_c0_g1_i1.p1  ORF type:complete len:377 (-),score=37.69 TRINITY_DN617_c0_g1_i1:1546-2676(-)